ncbi:MAG: hypothetical protein F4060_02550 [Holophagales bacterium]|nr:hypothetical protein [Holophagales bacterium]MXX62984.1 hypothetical protein [Holophagales bacterium]MYA08545.1 hypothetical protein [Holophagales bacterium]MYB20843.1 hypothetical protein [Holophagales bacterium]MYC11861.1 hypothetical protein [Holophagales bacterium]
MSDLVKADGALPAPQAALDAAAEIRTLWAAGQALVRLGQEIEAKVMEGLWTIRREVGDEGFDDFVGRHTPVEAEQARRMVDGWEVARKNRALRELAQSRPTDALHLLGEAVDAGVDLSDATDQQVADIMVKPPRRRHGAIRALIESAETGETPATREKIRALEEERDEALEQLNFERVTRGHPSSRATELIRSLEELERRAGDLAMDAVLSLQGAPETTRERATALAGALADSAERIGSLAFGEGDGQ